MKKYKVAFPVVFHSGKIQLTDEQAKKRSHQITKVKGDLYDILTPVSFKAGEVVGLEKASKTYLANLEEVIEEKVKK